MSEKFRLKSSRTRFRVRPSSKRRSRRSGWILLTKCALWACWRRRWANKRSWHSDTLMRLITKCIWGCRLKRMTMRLLFSVIWALLTRFVVLVESGFFQIIWRVLFFLLDLFLHLFESKWLFFLISIKQIDLCHTSYISSKGWFIHLFEKKIK